MVSGRSGIILGRRMVINLNTKGGVRKSPGTNALASCVGAELVGKKPGSRAAVRKAFSSAAKKCAKGA